MKTNRQWREVQPGKWQLYVGLVPRAIWADKYNTTTIDGMFRRIGDLTQERNQAAQALVRLVREHSGAEQPAPGFEHDWIPGRVRGTSLLDALALLRRRGWIK